MPTKKTNILKHLNKRSAHASDRELMQGIQKGDPDSFHQLYDRFSERLRKYAFKHTRSSPAAEELAQDILLKIYQFKQTYNSQYEVSTWIWAIAKNTVYDYFRQSKWQRKNAESIEEIASSMSNAYPFIETAESVMIQGAEKEAFQEMFDALSERQKKALFLRLVKNSSYQEISHAMNISLSAVKSLMNRAKATLIKANLKSQNDSH
ncbi:MAG: RNA polymerase sigma factor [Bdellovibrionia bacterium]